MSERGLVPSRRALGPDPEVPGADEDQLKLAAFHVGTCLYGIDIMRIKEVIQAAPHVIRPVPHAPGLVEGVIQLRGVVLPVVDLRKRFGVAIDPTLARFNKLIIASVRGRIIGFKIDRILGELRLPARAVRPTPSMLRPTGHQQVDFFAGVCRSGEDMLFVLNLETLIDPTIASPGTPMTLPPGPVGKDDGS